MISATSFSRQNNPFESSIQQILQLDGLRRTQLTQELKTFETGQKALTDIGTAFSSFQTVVNQFEQESAESFQPLRAESSGDAVRILETDAAGSPGYYSIEVDNLARRDTLNSSQFEDSGDELSQNGTGSFTLAIGEELMDISVDTDGLSNREVLDSIASAISAGSSGSVSVSRLQVNDSESVLSVKSGETGSVNRISILNADGDFQGLGLTHLFEESELDASFSLDGVAFTRSSNSVDDAISGLSFELLREDTGSEQITVSRDTEKITGNIDSFIEAYNHLNDTIRQNTFLNSETGDRGPLQRERAIRNLSNSMRQAFLQPVESLSGEPVTLLTDIGISFEANGSMSVTDPSKLEALAATGPENLMNLFTATDGLISNIKSGMESSFQGDGNLIDALDTGFDSRIERTNTRIEREDRFLERREAELRKEFSGLLQIIEQGERQFNSILQFQSQFGF